MKKIAIVGGGKEGLSLLPLIRKSQDSRVVLIIERNPNALIFKLKELGYKIANDLKVTISSSLTPLSFSNGIDIIIDASEDECTRGLMESFHLDHIEIISPLSARLIWGHLGNDHLESKTLPVSDKSGLLASLKEIIDAVNLAKDQTELLSMVLRVALSSTGTERGSIMLLDKDSRLRMAAFEGIDEEIAANFRGRIGEGIAGKVAENGEALLLSGRVDDSRLDLLRSVEKVKAALSVPMLSGEKVVGVLNVSTNRGNDAFNEKDLTFLTELANLAAGIILRSQEIEEMRHQADNLLLWKSISAIMNTRAPMEKKLRQAAQAVSKHIEGECNIFLPGAENGGLSLKASSSPLFSASTHYRLGSGEGVEGLVAHMQRDIVLSGDIGEGRKAIIWSFPLVSEGGLQGVMTLRLGARSEEDLDKELFPAEMVSFLAKEISGASRDEKIAIRETRIAAINEAGINLISASNIKDIGRIVSTSAAMLFDAESTVFRLKEKGGQRFTLLAAYGADDKDYRISLFKLDKKLSEDAVSKGVPVLVDKFGESAYESSDETIRTGMCYPVSWGGEIMGTLSLYNKISRGSFEPVAFDKEDRDVVGRFLSYAEKALTNLYMFEKSHNMAGRDELTGLYNSDSVEKSLKVEMERSCRNGRYFSLALIEVKKAGDKEAEVEAEEIRKTGDILVKNLRGFDIVGRLGDCRFALLLPESEESGDEIIVRLAEKIEKSIPEDKESLYPDGIKVLHGCIDYRGEEKSVSQLMEEAIKKLG